MSEANVPVITIDGPSGSGKGTLGFRLAERLGWHFLDSGALYRVLALAAMNRKIPFDSEQELALLAQGLDVQFNTSIMLDNKPVSSQLRTEACGDLASKIAIFPKVRQALLGRQRAFKTSPGLVADGRDMGTVVFPEAIYKFFLDSSPEERAKRRYIQLKEQGHNVSLEDLLGRIVARDARDIGRASAPLKPAKDAIVIDTTAIGADEVVERVLKAVQLPSC